MAKPAFKLRLDHSDESYARKCIDDLIRIYKSQYPEGKLIFWKEHPFSGVSESCCSVELRKEEEGYSLLVYGSKNSHGVNFLKKRILGGYSVLEIVLKTTKAAF